MMTRMTMSNIMTLAIVLATYGTLAAAAMAAARFLAELIKF